MKKVLGALISFVKKLGVAYKVVVVFLGNILKKVWEFLKNNPISKVIATPKGIKATVWICFVIAIAEFAFGILVYGYKSTDKITAKAAAIVPYPITAVNEGFISYNQFIKGREYIHHFYNSTVQQEFDFDAIDKEILNQLIENRLVSLESFLYGKGVKGTEVDATFDQIIEQNGGKEQVEKVLSDLYGLNVEQFKKLIRTQILRDKINNELIMRVTARHILVRADENVPPEKVAETKAKIEGIKTEIQNGLDFAEAAKKYSEDTGSAENGGLLESFAKGEMVEEFSKVAFTAEVGKISDPVRTSFGWHIIKAEKRTGKIDNNFTDWLASLKKNSLIIKFIK